LWDASGGVGSTSCEALKGDKVSAVLSVCFVHGGGSAQVPSAVGYESVWAVAEVGLFSWRLGSVSVSADCYSEVVRVVI
jgi:hypothetical protein